eukprot:8433930-Alexandrium_andersonii.AAC.1
MLARGCAPELAGPVAARCDELGAVRREGRGQNPRTVATQRQRALARGRVPELRRVVVGGR